ncbi:MAG: SsrA-binding protein [Planctomycetota bacterium]|jgi:SsrA-binding protein
MAKKPEANRSITRNKKATHNFLVLEELECGMVLLGTEVKSLRAGQCSIAEAYARIHSGGMWLMGATIPEYRQGNTNNHPPTRERKLLIHKKELERWGKKVRERGVTIMPLEIYFQGSLVKCRVGLCRGKKLYDKRQSERDKDDKRSMARELKRNR